MAPGVLAERQRHRHADRAGIDDLVRPLVLEHPVLVDAGLVREGVRPDDGLVRLDDIAGQRGHELRRGRDLLGVDARVDAEVVGADIQRDHDLLERRVARPLADPVDRALDLADAGLDGGERVRDREAEVVVAVRGERDPAELGTAPPRLGEERRVLVRQAVPDGVGKIDHGRARLDRDPADTRDERAIGASRVLARELDLVGALGGVRDRPPRLLDHLRGLEPELLLHVQRARRDENVDPGAARIRERLAGRVEVVTDGSGEGGDGRRLDGGRHRARALEVTGRRAREAGLDDVDAEPLELLSDLRLLVGLQRDAR